MVVQYIFIIPITVTIAINIVFFFDDGSGDINSDNVEGSDRLCSYSAFLLTHRGHTLQRCIMVPSVVVLFSTH